MAKFFTVRIWILVIAVLLSIFLINPKLDVEGIEITNVALGSVEYQQGLSSGEVIKSINNVEIKNLIDYKNSVTYLEIDSKEIILETNVSKYEYSVTDNIKFIQNNLTIVSVKDPVLNIGEKILKINNQNINNLDDFNKVIEDLFPQQSISILTDKGSYSYLTNTAPKISVSKVSTTNLKKGLELEGGTRVLIKPISDNLVTDQDIENLIEVMEKRLNVYGLSDIRIRSADVSDEKLVLIEISGVGSDEVKSIISQQGKFEAKIGEDIVFVGGNKDIPFVCRDDGSCSGVSRCNDFNGQWQCVFQFQINLSPEATKKHAEVTSKLEVIQDDSGGRLDQPLDLYLDDILVNSLQISAGLKGLETNQIVISGPGFGDNQELALNDALLSMNELQTVLVTGSLPFKIEILKLDSISPILGNEFIKNAFLVALSAIVAIALVIYIRYRNFKIMIPMIINTVSEIIIILGIAALIKWNLDLVAIAGIIAAVGTGVDDQIILADEIIKGKIEEINWNERIKRAFFIIMTAYATTVVAMIPLWNAGAGLVRGFAVITIIGVSIGVFITRPAFASIAEKLLNK
tara:strand:+ start:10791 stop:12515 length:1725 start_codon:yes stop_codon:yes gene_type:complete